MLRKVILPRLASGNSRLPSVAWWWLLLPAAASCCNEYIVVAPLDLLIRSSNSILPMHTWSEVLHPQHAAASLCICSFFRVHFVCTACWPDYRPGVVSFLDSTAFWTLLLPAATYRFVRLKGLFSAHHRGHLGTARLFLRELPSSITWTWDLVIRLRLVTSSSLSAHGESRRRHYSNQRQQSG